MGVSTVISCNYLCTAMNKITFIFLLLFSLVEVAPAFMVHHADTTSVFIAEDKNGEEKKESAEDKDQKYFSQFSTISEEGSHGSNTVFHLTEKIYASPCFEKLTPPPNFYCQSHHLAPSCNA